MINHKQSTIFDFLSNDSDPIFVAVSKADKNRCSKVGEMIITKNPLGYYEIESDTIHEQFTSINDCYTFLCDKLENYQIGGR